MDVSSLDILFLDTVISLGENEEAKISRRVQYNAL